MIVTEARIANVPELLIPCVRELPHGIAPIGLESSLLSGWPCRELTDARFEVVLMESWQVEAMSIKTDRRVAEGVARLL